MYLSVMYFDCCVSSVKTYRLGTSKCHDHGILTVHFISQSDNSILSEITGKGNSECAVLMQSVEC